MSFTGDKLDSRVNKYIPAIQQPLVSSKDVMDVIVKEYGAIWGIIVDDDYDEPVLP